MKKICILFALFAGACKQVVPSTDTKEIMEADKAFSAMCAEKGMEAAFVAFAADDVVKLQNRQKTIMGKKELIESFKRNVGDAQFKFTWEPLKADVFGDIGYTYGRATLPFPDSTGLSKIIYIDYITVWKKQKDGTWKYQADGGNVVPAPDAK